MSGSDRDRAARLAEALRENLRRRKAQARSRRETDAARVAADDDADEAALTDRDGQRD